MVVRLIVNRFLIMYLFSKYSNLLRGKKFQLTLQYANEFLDVCPSKTGQSEVESDNDEIAITTG